MNLLLNELNSCLAIYNAEKGHSCDYVIIHKISEPTSKKTSSKQIWKSVYLLNYRRIDWHSRRPKSRHSNTLNNLYKKRRFEREKLISPRDRNTINATCLCVHAIFSHICRNCVQHCAIYTIAGFSSERHTNFTQTCDLRNKNTCYMYMY